MSNRKLLVSGKIWSVKGQKKTLFFRLSKRRFGGFYVYHLSETMERIGHIDTNNQYFPEATGRVANVYFPYIWKHRKSLVIENGQYGISRHCRELYRKARSHSVNHEVGGGFNVKSGSSGKSYLVHEVGNGGFTCTCTWAKHRKTWLQPCSHCLAVELELEKAGDRALRLNPTLEDAKRQKRTLRRLGFGVWGTSRQMAKVGAR